MTDPTGFLNLNKPAGMTSHDCVAAVRRILRTRRVGHGGTLDPDATGVLPIAVGKATRFLAFLPQDKGYRATFRLGQTSTTDDASGEPLRSQPCPELQLEQVESCLTIFQGQIQQIPPIYSAVRQQGKRLYELARAGFKPSDLEIPARPVQIHRLQILAWRPGDYPELDLEIDCGAGTYIRAIARDLGQQLGCGGLMSRLLRWQSSGFLLDTSIELADLECHPHPEIWLEPIEAGFSRLSLCELDPEQTRRWCCGQILPWTEADWHLSRVREAESNRFLGLGTIQQGQLKAIRVLT